MSLAPPGLSLNNQGGLSTILFSKLTSNPDRLHQKLNNKQFLLGKYYDSQRGKNKKKLKNSTQQYSQLTPQQDNSIVKEGGIHPSYYKTHNSPNKYKKIVKSKVARVNQIPTHLKGIPTTHLHGVSKRVRMLEKQISVQRWIQGQMSHHEKREDNNPTEKYQQIDNSIQAKFITFSDSNRPQNICVSASPTLPDSQQFIYFLPLHQLWLRYTRSLLSSQRQFQSRALKLARSDLHGALITIIASPITSYVGLHGIIVRQSLKTWIIADRFDGVGKLILKDKATISLQVDGMEYIIQGSAFGYRATDRAKHKFKQRTIPKEYGNCIEQLLGFDWNRWIQKSHQIIEKDVNKTIPMELET